VEPPRTQRLKAHPRIKSPNYESEIHSHLDPETHIRGIMCRLQTKVADNNKCLVCGRHKDRDGQRQGKKKEIHKIDQQGESRWSVREKYNSQKFEVSQHYCFLWVATVEPPRTQRLKAHPRIESPNYESEIHSHLDPEKYIRGIMCRLQTKVADNNKCLVCG